MRVRPVNEKKTLIIHPQNVAQVFVWNKFVHVSKISRHRWVPLAIINMILWNLSDKGYMKLCSSRTCSLSRKDSWFDWCFWRGWIPYIYIYIYILHSFGWALWVGCITLIFNGLKTGKVFKSNTWLLILGALSWGAPHNLRVKYQKLSIGFENLAHLSVHWK